MEKLEPLLKHKYWIVAGLALLVPFVGWMITSSAQAKAIDERISKLDSMKVVSGTGTPNAQWNEALQKVNDIQAKRQRQLEKRLYNEQKQLWTWPREIAGVFNGEYRQAVDLATRNTYRFRYPKEFESVVQIVDPHRLVLKVEDGKAVEDEKGQKVYEEKGLVLVNPRNIHMFDYQTAWQSRNPTVMEMWDAQEDIWLTRSLMKAIARVNEGSASISDSSVREIIKLSLHGGTPPAEGGAASGGDENDPYGSAGSGEDYDEEAYGGAPGGNALGEIGGDPSSGYDGGMGTSRRSTTNAGFAPSQVFGSDAVAAAASSGEGEDGMNPSSEGNSGLNMLMGGPTGNNNGPKKRYYDDNPEMPYKTRGFYLEVVIQHDKLPDLQAALLDMEWRTELLRVQWVAMNDGDFGNTAFASNTPQKLGGAQIIGRPSRGPIGRSGLGVGPNGLGGNQEFGPSPGELYDPSEFDNPGSGLGSPGSLGSLGAGGRSAVQTPLADAAMQDPYLAHVAIAGLMTIYRSPDEDPDAIREAAEAEDAASGTVPTTPASPETTPGEGTTEGQPSQPGSTEPNGGQPGTDTAPPTDPNQPGPAVQPNANGASPTEGNPDVNQANPKQPSGTAPPSAGTSGNAGASPADGATTPKAVPAGSP